MAKSNIGFSKDLAPLARKATKARIVLTHTGKGHIRWTAPNGEWRITSLSPRTAKAMYLIRAWLRSLGVIEA